MTLQEQIDALNEMVPEWAIQTAREVRGKFTSGEFVEYTLRRIFGPDGWAFAIVAGPALVKVSDTEAYAQVTGRLTVRFASGQEVIQDAVGVWPLRATRAGQGGTLDETTAAERYETVLKACCTDALKAAAERVGTCFRPMSDLALADHLKREAFRQTPEGQSVNGQSPAESEELLYGNGKSQAQEGDGPAAKSNGQANAWIMDDNTRAGFWASVREKGLTHDFVHKALKVESLKEYARSVSEAWKEIYAAIDADMKRKKAAENSAAQEAFDTAEQQEIPF